MMLPRGRQRSAAAVAAGPSCALCCWGGCVALLLGLAVLAVQPGAGRAPVGSSDIYGSGLVVAAPPPSLAGSSSRFEDARGAYERRCFGEAGGPPCVNVLFTRRGFLRSGDLHKDRQVNHVVSGSVRLTQRIGSKDVTSIHHAPQIIVLPPHTPHLYEFLEDTLMTEHWMDERGRPAEFRAWLYEPYRLRISNASLLRSATPSPAAPHAGPEGRS